MKSFLKLCIVALATAFCGVGCAAAASCIKYNKVEPADTVSEYTSENRPVSGMFFSAEYVVEEYEYDDAFCLLYDDPDANMCNVEICVDLETYQAVQKAIKEKREMVGSLVLNDDYSFVGVEVYTFMPEPEFEMAAASTKL